MANEEKCCVCSTGGWKKREGRSSFSSLSPESTDSGSMRPWSGLGSVSMGWQEQEASSLSQHQQQQQDMLSTCVGRAGVWKASGAARVGYRESASLSTVTEPVHKQNLANSKKWPCARGQAAFLQRSSACFRPLQTTYMLLQ